MRALLVSYVLKDLYVISRRPRLTSALLIGQNCCQFGKGNFTVLTNVLPANAVHELVVSTNQRYKSTKPGKGNKKPVEEEEVEEQADSSSFESEDPSKVTTIRVPSLRVDAVLKAVFGIPRNKVETAFYQNRVYLNGKLIPKKNTPVGLKNELDYVKGVNPLNDKFIDIMRAEILDIQVPKGENTIAIKLNRYRLLTIDNYSGQSWSGPNE